MQSIDREDDEEMGIYANVETINNVCRRTDDSDSMRSQTYQHTERENVRKRSNRSVIVYVVLLCVLLLTAVIVLCVLINTNNQQFNIKTKNITEERDQLLTKYINITEERDQLLFKYNNMTKEKDELLINNKKQSEKIKELLKTLNDVWIKYQSSLYLISSEEKNWTESRRYCRERGADLIIINNEEEQDFIKKNYGNERHWIGLTDIDEKGRWKWVDGSTLDTSSRFWKSGDPNNHGGIEDCVMTESTGLADFPCSDFFKWICEKKILK